MDSSAMPEMPDYRSRFDLCDNPLVSVIVPAYNASRFLATTLMTVRAQSYENWELIVVDDGSTDVTAHIVASFTAEDDRIRLVRQKNQGVAAARNRGMSIANGEFVAFLDSDDIWLSTKLARQVAVMLSSPPDVGLIYSWWDIVDEHGVRKSSSHPWMIQGEVSDGLVAFNFIGNCSVPLIRSSCLEEVGGFDESFRAAGAEGCEDWDLFIRIAEKFRIGLVPEVLVAYRRVYGTMSGNVSSMLRSHSLMLTALEQRRLSVPPKLKRDSRGMIYGYLIMLCIRTGRIHRAVALFLQGMISRDTSLLSPWMFKAIGGILLPSAFSRARLNAVEDHS